MLLNYQFANFCSFEDETTFSMKPGRLMDRFEDNIVRFENGAKALKSAVIVGENAGGKTNFIQSIQFLQSLFNTNDPVSSVKKLVNFNARIQENTRQSFDIEVVIPNAEGEQTLYRYTLDMDEDLILEESLSYKQRYAGEYKEIFFVAYQKGKISYDNSTKQVNATCHGRFNEGLLEREIYERAITGAQGLAVTSLALIEPEVIRPFVRWFTDTLLVESPAYGSIDMYKGLKREEQDLDILRQDSFLEIFSLIDETITGIEIDEDAPYKDSIIIRDTCDNQCMRTELKEESSGIREYFAWALQIWKVVYEDKVLFADEVDRVLNPILAQKIVAYVHGTEHRGQFVFTTHNILHLNTIDFMKQQLWFVVKHRKNLNSEMYSLADFPEFRYDKVNIYDWYLKGILGGAVND